jgi:hypothetical protein
MVIPYVILPSHGADRQPCSPACFMYATHSTGQVLAAVDGIYLSEWLQSVTQVMVGVNKIPHLPLSVTMGM